VGEGKESARAQVLAARALLDEELVRLEASARAAVDIRAQVRRSPVKAAGMAAGAGFVVLGGPKKVLRGARNAIFGKPDPLPKSMLPDQIEKALGELGADGARVRGTLEREFAGYLEATAPRRRERDLPGVIASLLGSVGKPLARRYGRQLVEQLLTTEGQGVADQMAKIRARAEAAGSRTQRS
jgi:hypothetical protein